jgi:hypothetical protein
MPPVYRLMRIRHIMRAIGFIAASFKLVREENQVPSPEVLKNILINKWSGRLK